MVNMENEYVSLTTRGVWHELYEAITGNSQKIPNPTKLKIKDLLHTRQKLLLNMKEPMSNLLNY